MILCRVIGNVVSTAQHPAYDGRTVLVVQPVQVDTHTARGSSFLAVDGAQAGVGDLILAAREGNTARQLLKDPDAPLHAVVVGIVDSVECM